MARPWIKVEPAIVNHPKTRQLAKFWGCHPYQVVGFLVALWGYCVEYQEDGNVDGLPSDVLEEFAAPCCPASGTVRDVLQQVGLVDADGRLHDWDEYTGELIERRRKDRERKRLERRKVKEIVRRTGRGQGADGRGTSGAIVEQSSVRKTSLSTTSSPNKYPEAFERVWSVYPTRAGGNPKRSAFRAWSARLKAGASAEELQAGVERYRRYCETMGKVGTQYVLHAATFFGPDEHFREPWTTGGSGGAAGLRDSYLQPKEVDR